MRLINNLCIQKFEDKSESGVNVTVVVIPTIQIWYLNDDFQRTIDIEFTWLIWSLFFSFNKAK